MDAVFPCTALVAPSPAALPVPWQPETLRLQPPTSEQWQALQDASGTPRQRQRPGFLRDLQALVDAGHLLAIATAHYLWEAGVGQSPHTVAAKCRDLLSFCRWYGQINQHTDPAQWQGRDTRLYLRHLEAAGRSPVSINRGLASLRHFARWLHDQPGGIFLRSGLPTRGVGALHTEEADCKKLDARQMHALFKAADNLVALATHRRARPRRNRALLALLYYTGLRVQELCRLNLAQLKGHHLVDVLRKGRVRTRSLYLVAEARRYLTDYLHTERPLDDPDSCAEPLLLAQGGQEALSRRDLARALDQIAAEANKRRTDPIALHPHRLRHTFGSLHRAKTLSDSETAAALGHTSLKYVGRYTRQTDQERDAQLEATFAAEGAVGGAGGREDGARV
jgi:integrase/recombinase XerD